jgi:copper homeostasis protein (lipoprotein)
MSITITVPGRSSRPALLAFAIAACGPHTADTASQSPAPLPPDSLLPGTYTGALPCADCPGIRYTVELRPDRVFFLRTEYSERRAYDDIGLWARSSDGRTLTLRGGREAPVMFAIKSATVLHKLDVEGKEIESRLNYDLVRADRAGPLEPVLPLRGMYSYFADAGLFRECLTNLRLPVAQEGDNAALETAYARARRQPAETLWVAVEGRIARRPRMEGSGEREVLVVDKFTRVSPGETCATRVAATGLENTHWTLVRLGDVAVVGDSARPEPHIVLAGGGRMQGSGGCNRLTGGYTLAGDTLRFSPIGATRMACPGAMEQEAAFTRALPEVTRWKVVGRHLELYDGQGTLVARFEAKSPQ